MLSWFLRRDRGQIGETYKGIAFVVGHVGREACGERLLEDGEVAGAGGIVHAGCEGNHFGGFGGWLDNLVAAWTCHD